MTSKETLARFTRGWLPEEPKMPKSKLRRAFPPIAIFLTTIVAVSLFSSALTFSQPATPPTVPTGTQSVPAFASVKFKGVLQENNSFLLVLSNGSHINSKELTLSLSLNEKTENEYNVQVAVEGGGFFNETSVDGYLSDGKLIVNAIPSVFLTKTEQLEKGNQIRLSETADWKLDANVDTTTAKLSTAIDGNRVAGIRVSSSQLTESGWPMQLMLGYDPATGILVYSGYSLSDVLLKAIGIELILGGSLELTSYSDNLDLKLAKVPPSGGLVNLGFFLFILGLSSPVVLAATFVVHRISKKRKRTRVDPLTVQELRDDSTRNCGRKGW